MANVFEQVDVKNSVSRNGFDLSENTYFTARAGEIVPFFCKMVMPGDKVKLYPQHFSRTMPLNTSAFTRIKEQVNFFKVRLHLLHNQFDTFVTQMNDNLQSSTSLTSSQPISDTIPYISQADLYNYIKFLDGNQQAVDELGYKIAPRTVKLLQYLGYGDFSQALNPSYTPPTNLYSRKLNPFPLLAYQKVYYDFFRYQQWENSSPWCFNINFAKFGTKLSISDLYLSGSTSFKDSMFTLRYANFPKDYFLGVLPNSQYGDTSVVPVNGGSATAPIYVYNSVTSMPSTTGSNIGTVGLGNLTTAVSQIVSNPSVLAIRKAEALQKLKEIQQSGDQDYKSQIEKIFNVNVSDLESDLCEWLGGYSSNIDVSEVINNNLSTESSQADIKGKGIGSGQREIEFESKDFSIIIGVYTAIPELVYDIEAPSSLVTSVMYDDMPNPVLDKIGMETLPVFDIIGYLSQHNAPGTANLRIGYVPRYWKYKASYDRVIGGFSSSGTESLKTWVAPYNNFVETFYDNSSNLTSSYLVFKVNPNVLNPIFSFVIDPQNESQGTMQEYYSQEQFIVNMSVGCPMVRPLDYNGLPY